MKRSVQFLVAGATTAGQRLDVYLAERLPQLSRLRIARLLAEGGCSIDGQARHGGYHVRAGDEINIELPTDPTPGAMTPEELPLEIVYEDDQLLVIDKPAGMLVHPTRGVKSGTLANALAYYLNRERIEKHGPLAAAINVQMESSLPEAFIRPGLVHRLDRATSGLVVVAKTQRALSLLSRHVHRRLMEKHYLALLHGVVRDERIIIEAPIGREEEAEPKWGVREGGKPAETRLKVLKVSGRFTLVELEPVTGRTNQLRIHCAHLKHPIVGDEWYGSDAPVRLCLHAARLAFNHPSGNRWMDFTSPLPSEMENLIGK